MDYEEFVSRKLTRDPPTGIASAVETHPSLFPFQHDIVRWALRRGRCAVFADTGLGKTRMQLAWADAVRRHTARKVLILAPLAVAQQTAAEGRDMGMIVTVCRDANDVQHGINVTNYDRLHRFDTSAFGAVVLDESSVIKHHDAKTLGILLEAFAGTPFKLCATATPAPNDFTELGTHAEFLGVCTRSEMLAEFFCHDGGETQKWRLKGHARVAFWRWVASWAAMVRRPSDLGYADGGYSLPPVRYVEHTVAAPLDTYRRAGFLFAQEAQSLMDRRNARRSSVDDRVAECAAAVNAEPGEPWIVWCDLNAESEALTKAIDGAVELRGSHTAEEKEDRLSRFAKGEIRVLVTKPSIAGFGLNWQHSARMAFVGVTDSWESYYQAIRRCWRFGQRREVVVHVFASEAEGSVIANLKRKETDAAKLGEELARETGDAVRAEIIGARRTTNAYDPSIAMTVPAWLSTHED